MQIEFNGYPVFLFQQQTLEAFLKDRSIVQSSPGVAVAVNEEIVARADWPFCKLNEMDRIELVHAVQGG